MNNFKGIGPYVMRQMDKPVGVDFTEFISTQAKPPSTKKNQVIWNKPSSICTQTHSHVELTKQNF